MLLKMPLRAWLLMEEGASPFTAIVAVLMPQCKAIKAIWVPQCTATEASLVSAELLSASLVLYMVVVLLAPSLAQAITSMTLSNDLVGWSQPGRLSVPRLLMAFKVHVTTSGNMLQPQLLTRIVWCGETLPYQEC